MARLEYSVVLESTESSFLKAPYDWCDRCWPYSRGAAWYATGIYPVGHVVQHYGRRFGFQFLHDAVLFQLSWGGNLSY